MVILEQTHLVKNKAVDNKKSMKYSIFQQALTIAVILLIIISTLLLLICTGFASQLLVTKSLFPSKEKNEETSHIGG